MKEIGNNGIQLFEDQKICVAWDAEREDGGEFKWKMK